MLIIPQKHDILSHPELTRISLMRAKVLLSETCLFLSSLFVLFLTSIRHLGWSRQVMG